MTQRTKSASILAVGTEITTGEIINGNAAWISRQLVDLGYVVDLHISVADDRDAIQNALAQCSSMSTLIFVTGGLGPTTDDFTRDEIAKFIDRPLTWHEPSWQHILNRLSSLNTIVAESNKQQCWFPDGSEILSNPEGTAAGFSFFDQKRNAELIVLPGPPQEIAAIWRLHLNDKLQSNVPADQKLILKRWITMGLSESKLGEIVEDTLKGSGLTTGYRSRIPYIDIKVWVPALREKEFLSLWSPKLETAVEKWLIGHDNDDLAQKALELCPPGIPVYIFDYATCGLLASRLYENPIPIGKQIAVITSNEGDAIPLFSSGTVITINCNSDFGTWRISAQSHGQFEETSRYKTAAHSARLKRYVCERSLQILGQWWAAR